MYMDLLSSVGLQISLKTSLGLKPVYRGQKDSAISLTLILCKEMTN